MMDTRTTVEQRTMDGRMLKEGGDAEIGEDKVKIPTTLLSLLCRRFVFISPFLLCMALSHGNSFMMGTEFGETDRWVDREHECTFILVVGTSTGKSNSVCFF